MTRTAAHLHPLLALALAACLLGCAGPRASTADRALRQGIQSGDHALSTGRLRLAQGLYASAAEQAALSADPHRVFNAVTRLAGVTARLGLEQEALRTLDEYLAVYQPPDPERTHVLLLSARIRLLMGDTEGAAEIAQLLDSTENPRLARSLAMQLDRTLLRALIDARLGHHEQAEAALATLDAHQLTTSQQAEAHRCRALLADLRGDPLVAAEHFLAESRLHTAGVRPDATARALAAAGDQFEQLDDHAAAARLLWRAADAYTALGRGADALTWMHQALENARLSDDHELTTLLQQKIETMGKDKAVAHPS